MTSASPSSSSPICPAAGEEIDDEEMKIASSAETLIPGLPDELSSSILSLLPVSLFPSLGPTSRLWRSLLPSLLLPLPLPLRLHHRHLLCLFPGDPHLLPPPHLLDPLTLLWLPLPPLPADPHSHSLSLFTPVSFGTHLFLLGGSRFDPHSFPLHLPSPSSSSFRLPLLPLLSGKPASWSPLPDMPTPRGSFACGGTPDGTRILVAGGGSRHAVFPCGGTRTDAVEALDVEKREWVPLEPMRRARAGCVGWVMKGDVGVEEEFWVVGGCGGYRTVSGVFPEDVHCRDGEVLGLRSGRWRVIGDMWEEGERRKLGKIAVVDVEEGNGGASSAVFMLDGNSIFRYNVALNRWLKETTLQRKLAREESCGFVAMNGELYVMTSSLPSNHPGNQKSSKRKAVLNMQIYYPRKRKWRFITTTTPYKQPLDFRIAVFCTIHL